MTNTVIESFTLASNNLIESSNKLDNELHDDILHTLDNFMDLKKFNRANTSGDIEETYTIVYTRSYEKGKL